MPPVEEEVEEIEEELEESSDNDEELVENEDESEEEDDEEEEEKPRANSQADNLWSLLNNQATAKSTLQTIASNLGLTISESKTEEGQKAIKDVIKEALGEDLGFLGDKLGPLGDAIERMIGDRISKAELKIQQSHMEREAARYSGIIENAVKDLNRETKGEFNAFLPKINKLMEEIPIGKQSPENYLKRLYGIAKTESDGRVKKTPTKEALREARRTSSNGKSNAERVIDGSSKSMSYRESIEKAIRDANKK
jgi:hypothetical protein